MVKNGTTKRLRYALAIGILLMLVALWLVLQVRAPEPFPPIPTPTSTPILTPTPTPMAALTPVVGPPMAFPDAQGFGAQAVGGRGGRVFVVTTLDDSGPGSLRACVEASGPRTCVFRTGGAIELESTLEVKHPYLTIAGQSAPGDGITLKAADPSRPMDIFKIATYEVIVRYIRSRPGTGHENARALTINAGGSVPDDQVARNIVIDHNSFSWAGDEIIIAWDRTHDVTFSWNILAESLTPGLKGPNLGKYGGGNYSFHHNLVAHHAYRLPNVSAGGGPTDLVNNVIYNFRRYGARVLLGARLNIVANYIAAGPDTHANTFYVQNDLDVPDPDSDRPLPNPDSRGFFVADNYIQGDFNGEPMILGILPPNTADRDVKSERYAVPPVTTTSAEQAYGDVLANAGAIRGLRCEGGWYERRDAVDTRIVESVRNGRSSRNTLPVQTGYISDPAEVGGWPDLDPGAPCPDGDDDGMPDAWEAAQGLNPSDAADGNGDQDGDGYTNLEEYLNGG